MATNIEKLQTRVAETKNQIEKSKSLSAEKKMQKVKELEVAIFEIKADLEKLKINAENKDLDAIIFLEQEYESLDTKFQKDFSISLLNLQDEITSNGTDNNESDINIEKKGRFKSQRDEIPDGGKNAIKVAGGIAGIMLLYKGIKSLFSNEQEQSNGEKEGFWDHGIGKGLKWIGVGLGGFFTIKYFDKIKDFLGLGNKLSFEDSLIQVESELGTISESNEINHGRGRLEYNEGVKQIKSYGIGTEINKSSFLGGIISTRCIEGLDIKFSDYKQLIHAANLVNYIKHKYKGRALSDTPFHTDSLTGYIYIELKSGNNETQTEEIISGGLFSTLSSICPDVLNGIVTNASHKDKFLAYLNKQLIWKEGDVEQPDANGDKVQEQVNNVCQEIKDTPNEFGSLGNERGQILAESINTEKTKYSITSRGNIPQETEIILQIDDNGNIRSGKIDGLSIEINSLEELVRAANLVNKIKYQYSVATPLLLGPTDTAFYWTGSYGLVGGHPGIYVDNSTTFSLDDRVVRSDTLESVLPTIFNKKTLFVDYLNSLKRANGKGFRER